jgi:hypothetical protein
VRKLGYHLRIQGVAALGPVHGNAVDAVGFLDFQGCVIDGHGVSNTPRWVFQRFLRCNGAKLVANTD